MNEKIKTSQAAGMPMSPVGNTIPTPTTHTASNGDKRELDAGAKAIDSRTHHEIFDALLASGDLDKCENCNQINKLIASVKGDGKVSTYFVNQRSHGWARVNGKWTAPTKEWLQANPFVAGARSAAAKPIVGRLSDTDLATLQAQIKGQETLLALADGATQAILRPILEGLKAKLIAHEKAVAEESLTAEKAKARINAEGAFRRVLLACDRAGVNWAAAAYGALRNMGAQCNLAPDVLDACLVTLANTDK